MLEIGFVSGGYSLFAFEKLGFDCTGLDNFYGGIIDGCQTPDYNKSRLSSSVNFCAGDITQKSQFPDESFDVIYSASVLEHIQDIPLAFNEMHRILKKTGVMIHGYNPFFAQKVDIPWVFWTLLGHMSA